MESKFFGQKPSSASTSLVTGPGNTTDAIGSFMGNGGAGAWNMNNMLQALPTGKEKYVMAKAAVKAKTTTIFSLNRSAEHEVNRANRNLEVARASGDMEAIVAANAEVDKAKTLSMITTTVANQQPTLPPVMQFERFKIMHQLQQAAIASQMTCYTGFTCRDFEQKDILFDVNKTYPMVAVTDPMGYVGSDVMNKILEDARPDRKAGKGSFLASIRFYSIDASEPHSKYELPFMLLKQAVELNPSHYSSHFPEFTMGGPMEEAMYIALSESRRNPKKGGLSLMIIKGTIADESGTISEHQFISVHGLISFVPTCNWRALISEYEESHMKNSNTVANAIRAYALLGSRIQKAHMNVKEYMNAAAKAGSANSAGNGLREGAASSAEIAHLKQQNADVQNTLEQFKSMNQTLTKELESTNARVNISKKIADEKFLENEQLKDELARLKAEMAKRDAHLKDMSAVVDEAERKLRTADMSIMTKDDSIRKLNAQLKTMEEKHSEEVNSLRSKKECADCETERRIAAETALAAANATIAQLKADAVKAAASLKNKAGPTPVPASVSTSAAASAPEAMNTKTKVGRTSVKNFRVSSNDSEAAKRTRVSKASVSYKENVESAEDLIKLNKAVEDSLAAFIKKEARAPSPAASASVSPAAATTAAAASAPSAFTPK